MIVKGATSEQIETAADRTGIRLYNFRELRPNRDRLPRFGFTLKTGSYIRRRVDWRGKLVWSPRYQRLATHSRISYAKDTYGESFHPVVPGAVCWHGHRDFMRTLLKLAPSAEIRTAMATYKGKEDFEASYRSTWGEGGSRMGMEILPYAQACTCVGTKNRQTMARRTIGGTEHTSEMCGEVSVQYDPGEVKKHAEWDYLWAVVNGYAEPQHGDTKAECLRRWNALNMEVSHVTR